MFARPRFVRNGIIFTVILFVLWRFQGSSPAPSTAEWSSLKHRMNDGASQIQYPESKSSFDWGAVKLRYLPNNTIALPKKSSRPLPRIQHPFGPESSPAARERRARLREVKKVALRAWQGYKEHAWMQDALLPISGGGREQFSGWAATLVDSLDTLWIMGLREEFDEAVAAVADIDFGNSTSNRINIFETNIRYLGGLLAAYDLSGRELLLKKAVELEISSMADSTPKTACPSTSSTSSPPKKEEDCKSKVASYRPRQERCLSSWHTCPRSRGT